MIKVIETIIIITLLIFAFFAGVKYSDNVKNHASWIFESGVDEIELPDLTKVEEEKIGEEVSIEVGDEINDNELEEENIQQAPSEIPSGNEGEIIENLDENNSADINQDSEN